MADLEAGDVLRLLASGLDVGATARRLNVTVDDVLTAVSEAARNARGRDAEQAVELQHLDLLRRALLPSVLNGGDTQAAWALVKIHDARVKLLGLAPPETFVPVDGPSELDRIRARREARRNGHGGA